jgi:hypothetical protein
MLNRQCDQQPRRQGLWEDIHQQPPIPPLPSTFSKSGHRPGVSGCTSKPSILMESPGRAPGL